MNFFCESIFHRASYFLVPLFKDTVVHMKCVGIIMLFPTHHQLYSRPEPFVYSSFPILEEWIFAANLHRDVMENDKEWIKSWQYGCFIKYFRTYFNLQEIPVKFNWNWLLFFLDILLLIKSFILVFFSFIFLIRIRFYNDKNFLFQETVLKL